MAFLWHYVGFFEFLINYMLTTHPASSIGFDMVVEDLLENTYSTWPSRNIPSNIGSHPLMIPNPTGWWNASNQKSQRCAQIRPFQKPAGPDQTMHGYVNHYNHSQTQAAVGGLTPLEFSNHVKHTGTKRQGGIQEIREVFVSSRKMPPLIRPS